MKHYRDYDEFDQATQHLPRLPYLETMVTHGCTLSCHGCTNYSDYSMSGGNLRWQDVRQDLDRLFSRVRIGCFGFIGGEPFLNRDFESWVRGFREEYPYVMLMVLSNAQLFTKNPWFLDYMEQYGMIVLKFTDHIPGAPYFREAVDMVLQRFSWVDQNTNKPVVRQGFWNDPGRVLDLHWSMTSRALEFRVQPMYEFIKTYRGEYGHVRPYDSNPDQAFDICFQQTCPMIYQGHLYKCSSTALLDRMLQDHGQLQDTEWQPYVHSGIPITAPDSELLEWVNNFGRPHAKLCRMCPTSQDQPMFLHHPRVINRLQRS